VLAEAAAEVVGVCTLVAAALSALAAGTCVLAVRPQAANAATEMMEHMRHANASLPGCTSRKRSAEVLYIVIELLTFLSRMAAIVIA
jgi:hydrogenase maturation factor